MTTDPAIETAPAAITMAPLRTTRLARLTHDLPVPHEWRRTGLYYPAMAQRIIVDVRQITEGAATEPGPWEIIAVTLSGGYHRDRATRTGGLTQLTVSTRYPATHMRRESVPDVEGIAKPAEDMWELLPDWAVTTALGMLTMASLAAS